MDQKTYNAINDPNVTFFILPTPQLLNLIEKNEHPYIKLLPDKIKSNFLQGYGISITSDMVINFLNGSLDEKNTFLLKTGEIRVFGAEEIIIRNEKK